MSKILPFLMVLLSLAGFSAGTNIDSGLVARHPFGNKVISEQKPIVLQTDASTKTLPVTTITVWFRPGKSYSANPLINTGDRGADRSLFTKMSDNVWHWAMQCGKDGTLEGPVVLADRWTFFAMLYDQKNQEARFIVDDQLYKSRARTGRGSDRIVIGGFNGTINDLRVYNRLLTLAELETLYGKKISAEEQDLVIAERYSYKEKRAREEAESVKSGDRYIVSSSELILRDSVRSSSYRSVLKEGDTLSVTSVLDDWLEVSCNDSVKGFVSRKNLLGNAYAENSSAMMHTFKQSVQNIFDFTSLRSWIIFLSMAVVLFFVKRYFYLLDVMLNRLRRRDPAAAGGSKSGGTSRKSTFLNRFFPPKRMQWWSMAIGAVAGLSLIVALIIDKGETEWFFNEGINLLPVGFDRGIHWFLFGLTWFVLLGLTAMVLESYVVTGPAVMWIRVPILLILNIMTFVVSIFLSIVLVIALLVMFAINIFGSGSSNYKCPHCGRTFSAGSGSSGTCPHCGGGVST